MKREAMLRVDRAVLEALEAFGLPRGQIRGLELWLELTSWNGRKHPDCTLFLSEIRLVNAVRLDRVDGFFSSWIHESLHARQPYDDTLQEYREWPGYEEGLVSALTHRVMVAGGISYVQRSFPYYVTAYEVLSAATDVDVDVLLKHLWAQPSGRVRQAFAATINGLRTQDGRPMLDQIQLAGDLLFRVDRIRNLPDDDSMMTLVRRILR